MSESKKALITGAAGGIGKEISLSLAKLGYELSLFGTRIQALQWLSDEIVRIGCKKPLIRTSKLPELPDDFSYDDIDILINNAGITKDSLLIKMKDEDYENVMQVNLKSVFKLSKLVLKGMMKRRFGRIINISSVVGITGNPGQTNYCASKAGMIGFSKALALEIASRGITVNCIAPGFIETPMTSSMEQTAHDYILSKIPLKTLGTPIDIAKGVMFLIDSPYVTGQTLHIDGGLT